MAFKLELKNVRERDVDYLLVEELYCNPAFRSWLVCRVRNDEMVDVELLGLDQSASTIHGESDVQFVYHDREGSRRAILIENKIGARFTERQAERYQARGREGVREGKWDCFDVVLIAPEARLDGVEEGLFPHRISYEEIAERLKGDDIRSEFKWSFLTCAARSLRNEGWSSRTKDEETTAWFRQARQEAIRAFPSLAVLPDETGRAAGNTEMVLQIDGLPKSRASIEIKPWRGWVDLRLTGVNEGDVVTAFQEKFGSEGSVVKMGKSWGIRTQHQKANVREPFDPQIELMRPMFETADRLLKAAKAELETLQSLLE